MTDYSEIIKYLKNKENTKKENLERERIKLLEETSNKLHDYFANYPECSVFLFGSLIKKYCFHYHSDIDIAVEGWNGSRLDLYSQLSSLLSREIDIVLLEKSNLKPYILHQGLQII